MTNQAPMTGAVAANLHEGSRSEYLAQFVFSSFGTAVPVPHQEDSGLDIYCTLLERDGQRAWPRAYYSVQVKSSLSNWVFSSPESVRWFVEHPLPIFLCVVQKDEARIIVYPTFPRFVIWSRRVQPSQLILVPGAETETLTVDWSRGDTLNLRGPILNFTIQEMLDEKYRLHFAEVLKSWIDCDVENLARINSGIHSFCLPGRYCTNEAMSNRGRIAPAGAFRAESLSRAQNRLQELLVHVASHYYYEEKDLATFAIFTMALRQLSMVYSGQFELHDAALHLELNRLLGMEAASGCEACDSLLKLVRDKLAQCGLDSLS